MMREGEGIVEQGLTERQMEVVGLVATGATNAEIGVALGIKYGTVKNHITTILSRLELGTRVEVAIYALKQGWVELDEIELRGRRGIDESI